MIAQTEHYLNSAAQILKITQEDLILQGLRSLLEKQLRELRAEIFAITGKYGISGVTEMEQKYRQGTLEEADSWQDFQKLDHLEFKKDQLIKLLDNLP